ncbi:MAG: cyclodeaminase/cyclohydrolase family protein [Clostridia bacterium]|nr:cyclodeaminase/cyclohydrolase family protein [Clostridia bacterium]
MDYTKLSLKEYSEKLSSGEPVPGGGGTSASVGALAASLGLMVGSLTLGREKYADVEDRIKELMKDMDELRLKLIELCQADTEVFKALHQVYSMPKESEEDKAKRREAMELALREAARVPYEIVENTCKAVDLMDEFSLIGNKGAVSDAGTGAAFAMAAINGAALNVFINTKSMKDRAYANELNDKVLELMDLANTKAGQIYDRVKSAMLGE